ncbi:hypothetical protein [Paenibacillus eucommiae]|uniref:Uncharacterized protein n=1 Tax=Paenibacillus eucommiae TaxID=1355755 RepID=A0ABS4JAH6_9BACL|nr:hypothetical protein [Paenibacillus eucommiae]MBP1996848.1 hypothetical protein [Paenibacillus eucommiae]
MQQPTLQAAFRKVKITPEETAPLQGYDPSVHIASPEKDILDDLYARVLVVDDGETRQVIVSMDCCLTNEEPFEAVYMEAGKWVNRRLHQTFPAGTRARWADAAGVEEASVSVHATHTHSAPEHFGEKYTIRIDEAILDAISGLQPVRIRAASGAFDVSVNRRPQLQHNDSLEIDRTWQVVVFETYDGRALGAIVNGAVHPTLLMNPFNRVSSEFVGLAMSEFEREKGEGFVSLFIQGFSADAGPIHHYRTEKYDTYPWVKELGHKLYESITQLTENLQFLAEAPLKSTEKIIGLPTKDGYIKPSVDVRLHGVRIGDLLLCSVSAEVFNGYIGYIKAHSPAACTMFAGIANGCCGYLPTPEAFGDGLEGYEMIVTPYKVEACELFIQSAIELVESLA